MDRHVRFQRRSRRAALCGVLTALSLVILSLGSLIPLATFACPMLAMLCLLPAVEEYGAGTALLLYAAAALLALPLCPDKEVAALYLFLGWYPALRPRLNRWPLLPRTAVKCALFSLSVTVLYLLLIRLFRLEAVTGEFAEYSVLMIAGLLLLGNITFLLFDRVLDTFARLYQRRRRAK